MPTLVNPETPQKPRKRYKHPYGHTRPWSARAVKAPTGRERIIARQLIAGATMADAVRVAGYTKSTVKAKAYDIAKRPGVRAAVIELAQGLISHLPAIGNFSESQMRESFSEELDRPETALDELTAMIRGAVKLIAEATSTPKPRSKPVIPELSAEQKASLEQRVVELQQAAQVSPHVAERGAGSDGVTISTPDENAREVANTSIPSPPAFGGAEPSPELMAIAEAQERETNQRELKQRQQRRDLQWWSKRR
jgi:hypothetical protein